MLDWTPQPPYTAEQLLQVIRILRDPENGCPWDKVQTHASIRKNFLEETCEALEAIDADDAVLLREELGDVLMQVVFHAAIEEERGRFTFEDVCRNVCEKLVFRHPNIFASSAAENAGINGWDALKNKEKGRTTLADELATVPATLPALMRAQKLQKRAAGHGLGQQDAAAAQHQLEAAVQDIVNRTVDAFQKGDVYAAGKIEPLEQVVDGLVREVKSRHIARLQAGANIFNVSAAAETPAIVRSIRERYPDVPIIATGGPTDESILETIQAGANAITWTPPTNGEIFRDIMAAYRDNKPHP